MTRIFIDGNQGTTGLRIVERLHQRTDAEILTLPEADRKDLNARCVAIQNADIAFLCLPDAAAREIAAAAAPRCALIDASTAHRINPDWCYGFPELSALHRARIAKGGRIAVPGCHASGFLSLVYPLLSGGLVAPDYPFVCHSVTGYSGGGKAMIAAYENPNRPSAFDAPRQYGIAQFHKHLPEMQAVCKLSDPPAFSPIVADYPSGMVVTVPLSRRIMVKPLSVLDLHAYFSAFYAASPVITVLPFSEIDGMNGFVAANTLAGSDRMEIIVAGNDDRLLLISRFDNLGKGASGAAIQCMNIALGLCETTGLIL